jgi:hypothetical protein
MDVRRHGGLAHPRAAPANGTPCRDPRLPRRPRPAAGPPPFEEHFDLCPSTVTWINAAAWADPYINLLIAHPDDRDRLAPLPDHQNLRFNALGPYRNRTSVGLLD